MGQFENLLSVLQKLQESSQNLSKDLDPKDTREQTSQDLNHLSSAFQQLQSIFSSINKEDMANMEREFNELISGKQNFLDYTRDVSAILMAIRNRASAQPEIKEKIEQNLPQQLQGEKTESILEKYTDVLNQILGMSSRK